jgi:hypothetical protein
MISRHREGQHGAGVCFKSGCRQIDESPNIYAGWGDQAKLSMFGFKGNGTMPHDAESGGWGSQQRQGGAGQQ